MPHAALWPLFQCATWQSRSQYRVVRHRVHFSFAPSLPHASQALISAIALGVDGYALTSFEIALAEVLVCSGLHRACLCESQHHSP